MKKLLAVTIMSVLMSGVISPSWAGPKEDAIKTALRDMYNWSVEKIEPSPIPSLWQVWVQNRLFYVDEGAKHLVAGPIVDTATREDLSAKVEAKWRWETFPRQDAIKQVFGDGHRELVVFSDANCTYCAQMEKTFEQVSNVTVYTFVVPILRGVVNNREVVCAKDPAKAWHDWMSAHRSLPEAPANCDASVLDRNLRLAAALDLTGVPRMYFASGAIEHGAIPAPRLDSLLGQ